MFIRFQAMSECSFVNVTSLMRMKESIAILIPRGALKDTGRKPNMVIYKDNPKQTLRICASKFNESGRIFHLKSFVLEGVGGGSIKRNIFWWI